MYNDSFSAPLTLTKIVSGGQTGVDRAALDWAMSHSLAHGGWCPQGRRAEDGRVPQRYALRETPESNYTQRTEWNVRDSDATLIISLQRKLTGGTKHTWEAANRLKRPVLHLHKTVPLRESVHALQDFLVTHEVQILNIAGPRATEEQGVEKFTNDLLERFGLAQAKAAQT